MSILDSPVTVFEIDLDYCSLNFGVGGCTASLGGNVVRKCFNTWNTCKLKSAYVKSFKTYRFVTENSGFPVGGNYIPALVSASGRSGTVNIAGADERLSSLGERAVINAQFIDFADSDTLTDKYQAERISGAAQIDEPGYNPFDRLSFWAKLKARNPNYAGRPCRIIQGTLSGGVFTPVTTRNFVLTEIKGPDNNGKVSIEAKDILSLADNNKAIAPRTGRGFLSADITASDTSVTLMPNGVGAEYSLNGFAVVGSEIVKFTRVGDVVTLETRGDRGTVAAAHKVNDTFQQSYSPRMVRIDDIIYDLLVNYAGINPAYITFSEWQNEVSRWAPNLVLTADICKPEGVAKLIGELAVLGVTIWWDDVAQKINLKINRPTDTDIVYDLTDDASIIRISQDDRDEDRLTRVLFSTVQINPTRALNPDNFIRTRLSIDIDAESPSNYNGQRVKEIYSRWLNHGSDTTVSILGRRMLNRFNRAPVLFSIDLDAKDDLALADVIRVSSRVNADDAGRSFPTLMQVIRRDDIKNGHKLKIEAQKFQFDQRYGYVTEDTRPLYSASNDAQKARGAYFVDETTLLFSDNTGPYVFS